MGDGGRFTVRRVVRGLACVAFAAAAWTVVTVLTSTTGAQASELHHGQTVHQLVDGLAVTVADLTQQPAHRAPAAPPARPAHHRPVARLLDGTTRAVTQVVDQLPVVGQLPLVQAVAAAPHQVLTAALRPPVSLGNQPPAVTKHAPSATGTGSAAEHTARATETWAPTTTTPNAHHAATTAATPYGPGGGTPGAPAPGWPDPIALPAAAGASAGSGPHGLTLLATASALVLFTGLLRGRRLRPGGDGLPRGLALTPDTRPA